MVDLLGSALFNNLYDVSERLKLFLPFLNRQEGRQPTTFLNIPLTMASLTGWASFGEAQISQGTGREENSTFTRKVHCSLF